MMMPMVYRLPVTGLNLPIFTQRIQKVIRGVPKLVYNPHEPVRYNPLPHQPIHQLVITPLMSLIAGNAGAPILQFEADTVYHLVP